MSDYLTTKSSLSPAEKREVSRQLAVLSAEAIENLETAQRIADERGAGDPAVAKYAAPAEREAKKALELIAASGTRTAVSYRSTMRQVERRAHFLLV